MWMCYLQMFWCWWHQDLRQSLKAKSACKRTTLWLPVTNLRRTPCLAPPVGLNGRSRELVWPVNYEGAPAVDISQQGPLCFLLRLRAMLCQLSPWFWSRTAGTTECQRQRLGPLAQVSLMLQPKLSQRLVNCLCITIVIYTQQVRIKRLKKSSFLIFQM